MVLQTKPTGMWKIPVPLWNIFEKDIRKGMILNDFIDREKDKERLCAALDRPDCQFIVVYGRRRIGKSAFLPHDVMGRDFWTPSDSLTNWRSSEKVCDLPDYSSR